MTKMPGRFRIRASMRQVDGSRDMSDLIGLGRACINQNDTLSRLNRFMQIPGIDFVSELILIVLGNL